MKDMMRIVVTVLNVLSSLGSLGMLWLGSRIVSAGLLSAEYHDYTAITVGVVLGAVFLIVPAVCVVASTKLARHDCRRSIAVSLVPLALMAIAIMLPGLALLILDPDD
jgi:predicted DNA repair protein MutK